MVLCRGSQRLQWLTVACPFALVKKIINKRFVEILTLKTGVAAYFKVVSVFYPQSCFSCTFVTMTADWVSSRLEPRQCLRSEGTNSFHHPHFNSNM